MDDERLKNNPEQAALCRHRQNRGGSILDRADADQPNRALTSWKGSVVRKKDIPPLNEQTTITNYLDRKTAEIDSLIAQKELRRKPYFSNFVLNQEHASQVRRRF